jgi:outer membrane protein, heavy metal efflux system
MWRRSTTVAACAVFCLEVATGFAQGQPLSLADVLARAREQAPELIAARMAHAEARAQLVGASVRWQTNPELDAAAGNRNGTDSRFTDLEFGLSQAFEPGSRRDARVAVANAAIARTAADVEATTRVVVRAAATAFYRALHAGERVTLLTRARELASTVHDAAERRFKAGDIAVLEVNIARAALARVRSDIESAEANRAEAVGDLRQLLRLDDVNVSGSLTFRADAALKPALEAAAQRPELRAIAAGIEEAQAELQLSATLAKADYGLGARYAREEGDHIVLGALTVTLPVFSKGQGQRALASARLDALQLQAAALQQRVRQEVTSRYEVYQRRLAAVRALESDAIPGMDENEQLTTRSFEVGQIGLPELLLLRREILDTRAQYLDALLEAVLARIEFDASAGMLR